MQQIWCKLTLFSALIYSWFKPLCNNTYCTWDVYACPRYICPSQVNPSQQALPITCQHLCIFLQGKTCCIRNFSRPEVTPLLKCTRSNPTMSCIVKIWLTCPAGQEALREYLTTTTKKAHSDPFTTWKQKFKFRLFSKSKVDRLTLNIEAQLKDKKVADLSQPGKKWVGSQRWPALTVKTEARAKCWAFWQAVSSG